MSQVTGEFGGREGNLQFLIEAVADDDVENFFQIWQRESLLIAIGTRKMCRMMLSHHAS